MTETIRTLIAREASSTGQVRFALMDEVVCREHDTRVWIKGRIVGKEKAKKRWSVKHSDGRVVPYPENRMRHHVAPRYEK